MKQTFIRPVCVDVIPECLENGVLYISSKYKTAIHKCCCGCGEEVVTPLSPADWSVQIIRNEVSLMPSIGNWSFECKSHYYIEKNQVIWADRFSQWEIDQVRTHDRADKDAFIKAVNHRKGKKSKLSMLTVKLWKAFVCWLKS